MIPADTLKSVAIIGNGLMGQGISQVFARAGREVTLIGRNPASLEKAMGVINERMAKRITLCRCMGSPLRIA